MQKKVNKTIGLLHKLQNTLPKTSLITIFKSFIRPRVYNTSFHQNIKSIQYNAALAFTGAVRGTSREKLVQDLGFKSLQKRRCYRKLCCLFKTTTNYTVIFFNKSLQQAPDILHKTQNHNPKGIRLISRLSLSLIHLYKHKFKRSF